MRNHLTAFAGMQPRIEPHLLPMTSAQEAVNTKLWSGGIRSFNEPGFVTNLAKLGTIKTIYRFGKSLDDDALHWFHFVNDADVTRGPIADDTQERTYYTEAGRPPMVTDSTLATADGYMPSVGYRLGIPAPTARAGVTVTKAPESEQGEGGTDAELERQAVLVAYTFVSGWGEEGPPNEVSDPVDAMTGDTLNLINMDGPPSGQYNITHKRLYVSLDDGSGDAQILRFWKEIPVGETTFSAELDLTLLMDALPVNDMVPPPEDMFGLMSHPGGFLVGFSGQKVYRSEVFKPYGWPYFTPLADDVVGGAVLGGATVVCTKGGTYMATQADPITFNPIRLNGWQPCVSKRSISVWQDAVVYASPDGLVGVDQGGSMQVLTEAVLTRDQWQEYKPESMLTAVHDGRIFVFYDTGAKKGGIIFDLSGTTSGIIHIDVHATAAYADGRRDALFLVTEDGKLHKWDAGANRLPKKWTSRRYVAVRPQNIGAALVKADGYPVQFDFHAVVETDDGPRDVHFSKAVRNARAFRMPGHYRAREYQCTVTGTNDTLEIIMASTLGNVTAE